MRFTVEFTCPRELATFLATLQREGVSWKCELVSTSFWRVEVQGF